MPAPDDDEGLPSPLKNAVIYYLVAEALRDFSAEIIALGRSSLITRDDIKEARASSIRGLKNSNATTLSDNLDAAIFRQAIEEAEKLIDEAVTIGWNE